MNQPIARSPFFLMLLGSTLTYTWSIGGVDPALDLSLRAWLSMLMVFAGFVMISAIASDKSHVSFPLAYFSESVGLIYVLHQGGFSFGEVWAAYMLALGFLGLVINAWVNKKPSVPEQNFVPAETPAPQEETAANVAPANVTARKYQQEATEIPTPGITFKAEKPRVNFSKVVGMAALKERLLAAGKEIVSINNSQHLRGETLEARNGMLLYGKPGNGKTFFAEALAGELNLPIVRFTVGDAASRWVNETTERVATVFRDAVAQAPCVLFIDEIDSFLVRRAEIMNADSETSRTVNTLLTEIVNLRSKNVVLIAATNLLDRLDGASIREGRFDFKIEITPPDLIARKALFTDELKRRNRKVQVDEADLDTAAKRWDGFSVARVRAIAQQVAQDAEKRGLKIVDYALIRESLRTVQGEAGDKIGDSIPAVDDLSMNVDTKDQLLGLVRRMEDIAEIEALGGTVPKGVLFYGPPGTGKTFAVQSLAKTAGWALLSTSGHDLLANPARIDELVEKAADIRPCIVFIDEADDALQDRRSSLNGHVTAKVLTALDGSTSTAPDVMFVAATNFPDVMDDAATRGGRLGEKIGFAAPDRATLMKFAQTWRDKLKVNLAANVSIEWLADMLEGLSIANLKEVLQQAVNQVIGEAESGQTPVVERIHVIEARHMIETEARA